MPIGLIPGQTFPVWLQVDAATPEATRPVFLARFLSWRDDRVFRAAVEEATKLPDAGFWDATIAALRPVLVGWRNLPGEFSFEALEGVLTLPELYELACAVARSQVLAEADLKKSVSPSSTGTGDSAASAAPPASA